MMYTALHFQRTVGKTLLGLVVLFLFTSHTLLGQTSMGPVFEEGNAAYNEGDFGKAATLYEQVIKMGQHSAALYYNLGSAYYKLNKVAESIYYFEKAKRLAPNDEDIRVNRAFAQNMTIDAIEVLPTSQLKTLQNRVFSALSLESWALLTVLLAWLLLAAIVAYLTFRSSRSKRNFFALAMLFIVGFIGSFSIAMSVYNQQEETVEAILFSKKVEIRSEPNERSEILFLLHEGTQLQVLDELQEWQKIRIANGSEGWIKNGSIRRLDAPN